VYIAGAGNSSSIAKYPACVTIENIQGPWAEDT
jgi:hypothetical protein